LFSKHLREQGCFESEDAVANIRQVADKAGVSIGTVSRVLNNKPGVGEETRQRVRAVAQELGYDQKNSYFPNPYVTHLGFLSPTFSQEITSNPFYADILRGVEQICRELHINLAFNTLKFEGDQLHSLPSSVKDNNLSGLFLVGGGIPQVIVESLGELSQLPIVLVDNCFPDCRWDTVMTDNLRGVRLATEYLIHQGHRHIALIGGPDHASIVERRLAYQQTLKQHDLKPMIVTPPNLGPGDGQWAVTEILRQFPETTALVCSNDEQAVGALRTLREFGYTVPDDFSLVGFDDINMVQFTTPPITTICVDRLTIGQVAVQLLLDRISFPGRPVVKITIGVDLIERASVCAPRTHKIVPPA
jgi:LacI family transcriptional regulator